MNRLFFRNGHVMRVGLVLLLAPVLLPAQNTTPAKGKGKDTKAAPAPQLSKLAWLAGSWRMEKAGRIVEEQWMAPAGGAMLGMSRIVAKSRIVDYEFMQIREGPGGTLFFIALPTGEKGAAYQLLTLSDSEVIFENREQDFPQRILYTHQADGSVLAAIEGPEDAGGQRKRIELTYNRVGP